MTEIVSFYSELEKLKRGQGNIAILYQKSGIARIIYETVEFGNDAVRIMVSGPVSLEFLHQVAKGDASPHFDEDQETPQEILLAYSDIASLQILKDIG